MGMRTYHLPGQKSFTAVEPMLPAGAMKTYQIIAPVTTHFRKATCAEVDCKPHQRGWRTVVEKVIDSDGKLEAQVRSSGRKFTEVRTATGIEFTFEAGQTCFKAFTHRVRVEKDPFFVVRGGDFRGNPTGQRRQHVRASDWVDDFAEHQDKIVSKIEQG